VKTGAEHLKGENGYENSFLFGVVIWIVDLAPYFSHPTGTSAILNAKATIPDKSSWEGCTQLNLVHFNPQKKRVSSFAKYPRTIKKR